LSTMALVHNRLGRAQFRRWHHAALPELTGSFRRQT
jgi:hypothetical protein